MFEAQGGEKVFAGEVSGGAGGDGTLDGEAFSAFDDGGDDGAAGEVPAVQDVASAAAVGGLEKLVFGRSREWVFATVRASSAAGSARGNWSWR